MMSRFALGIAIVILAPTYGCLDRGKTNATRESADASSISTVSPPPAKSKRIVLSLLQLIANPESNVGASVNVDGFLEMGGADDDSSDGKLFLNPEAALWDSMDAVEVVFRPCEKGPSPRRAGTTAAEAAGHSLHYVRVGGYFEVRDDGNYRVGRICSVEGVVTLKKPPENRIKQFAAAEEATKSAEKSKDAVRHP